MRTQEYLLTFVTYGSWLHGDDRGSMRARIGYERPNAPLLEYRRAHLSGEIVELCPVSREVVLRAIVATCRIRGWELHAAHVRTQHVHVVVSGNERPELILSALKAWSTRRLREAALVAADAKVWARHGSTRWLRGEDERVAAAQYVHERQGEVMARFP